MLISENNIRRLARTMLFSESSKKVFEANYSPSNGGIGLGANDQFNSNSTIYDRHGPMPVETKEDVQTSNQNNSITKTQLPASKHDLNVYVSDILNLYVDLSASGDEICDLAKKIENGIKGFEQ